MMLRRIDHAALALLALEAAVALYIGRHGPSGPIPLHFGLSGAADAWGDRTQAAWSLAGLIAVEVMVLATLRLASSSQPSRIRLRGLAYAQIIVLASFAAFTALAAGLAFRPNTLAAGRDGFTLAILSFAWLAIGAFLGKTAPNALVGVRTYWSRNSRLAWDKSNRLAGRIFYWAGLAGLIASPLLPEPEGTQALLAVILVGCAAGVLESWRVWRRDPDRTA